MLLQARLRGGRLGHHHRQPGSASGAPATGRSRVVLLVRSAASSTPGGQGSSSGAKAAPSSINSPTSRAATLTPQERRVLVESVAGVLQQPLLQQQPREASGNSSSGTVAQDPLVWFFSYGANMHVDMVSRRASNVPVVSRDPAFVSGQGGTCPAAWIPSVAAAAYCGAHQQACGTSSSSRIPQGRAEVGAPLTRQPHHMRALPAAGGGSQREARLQAPRRCASAHRRGQLTSNRRARLVIGLRRVAATHRAALDSLLSTLRAGQATLEALPAGMEPRFRPLAASQGQPCVHGVLYRLPASTLRQLHSRDQGYVLTQMEVSPSRRAARWRLRTHTVQAPRATRPPSTQLATG